MAAVNQFGTEFSPATWSPDGLGLGLPPHAGMLEAVDEGVLLVTVEGRVLDANPVARRFLDQAMPDRHGSVFDCSCVRLDGAVVPREQHPAAVVFATNRPLTGQVLGLWSSDGQVRWLRIGARPARLPGPGPAVRMNFVDVTDLVEAKRQLQENERRIRLTFDNTFQFIGLLDPLGRLLEANRTALAFIGRDELGELAGIHFADAPWWEHSPDDRAKLLDAIARAVKGEFVRFETTHIDAQGGIAYVDFSLRPLKDADGKVVYLIPEGRDVTARKRMEAALIGAKLEAEAANRAKDEFLATVSHELRTPLNAIIGFSEAILLGSLGPLDPARYEGYLKLIHDAGEHLRGVVSEVLDLSRIQLGTLRLDEETGCPAELVGGIVEMLAPRAAEAGLRLDWAPPAAVPALRADLRRLRQVVLNLVGNALKFTPAGGSVRVDLRQQPDGLAIVVADTGLGIEPDLMERIWQPFFQVDPTVARSHDGAGLGLPIARHFVEAHGGTIRLDCPPEGGTVATVLLPPERLASGSRPAAVS